MRKSQFFAIAALCASIAPPAAAAGQAAAGGVLTDTLADFSIEQLADIVITSVVRQETRLADAAASVYVISASDIRRSGAATLPEVLRLAPNLHVAQADARNYAITARGLSSTLENKLLVLIDGRSIYSPLFSGVFWDMHDLMLDDVERIEVISGPGATIWGANAVNGVINIITRPAGDTQGGLLALDAGQRGGGASLRHGGKLASGAHYRVYGKHQRVADTQFETGQRDDSGMHRAQAGFRIDWARGADGYTLSGDAYRGRLGQARLQDLDTSGVNLVARLTRRLGEHEQLRLQAYLDHTDRHARGGGGDRLDTFDIEAQHGIRLGGRHDVVWGGGYRIARDRVTQGPVFQFMPTHKDLRWANVFAQDEVALGPRLRLTVGLKFEHNNYTGTEALPNARLAWSVNDSGLLWASASRTVRAPSRTDRDLHVPLGAAGLPFSIDGGPAFESETARVLELGYRSQSSATLSYAATLFHADYRRLRTLEPVGGPSMQFQNRAVGTVRGVEMWSRWQATPAWRLDAGLTVQDVATRPLPGSLDITNAAGLGTNDAGHYWTLRSSHELARNLSADVSVRYVGSLPAPEVPSYREVDARLAWRPQPDLELAVAAGNLLHARHLEYRPGGARQFPHRTVQMQLVKRF